MVEDVKNHKRYRADHLLEEKGVNVQEMFGGEIETEDIDPDQPEGAPVSDEEIDFTGIGDDDDTEVKVEDKD